MIDERPAWARRMTNERKVRNWSQADAVRALKAHAEKDQPIHADDANLLRQWKRWEAGEVTPGDFYQPIIARTFDTATRAMFPVPRKRDADTDLLAIAGMDTLELVSRLQRSDMDDATLNGLRVLSDTLCSEYPFTPAEQLLTEGRAWLDRITQALSQRLTLRQHREVLVLGGWITLLIACVEHDTGNRPAAETTRRGALSLGEEADHGEIQGWAHEIRAWMNLTIGDYHGVVAAARTGTDMAPHQGVAVQLAAQEAKAWARIGDRRQTEVALDQGRRLLDVLPYPDNLAHHFAIDPTKFDFYAMDCYRHLAEDAMAANLAEVVIQASTDFDGTDRAPMRTSEAHVTRAVVAARQGDLELAIDEGQRAVSGQRKSLPTLQMVTRDLVRVLKQQFPNEQAVKSFVEHLRSLGEITRLAQAERAP
jgi:hypothetical protein